MNVCVVGWDFWFLLLIVLDEDMEIRAVVLQHCSCIGLYWSFYTVSI